MILHLGNLTQDIIRKEDEYLVEVLLSASKKAITRLWYKTEPPTVEQWVSTVEEIYVMEKITHKPRHKQVSRNHDPNPNPYRTKQEDTISTTGQ